MRASYRLVPVHRDTWSDMASFDTPWALTQASVTKELTDGVCLIDSATMTVSAPIGYEFQPGWYRLEARISDAGSSNLTPLGTFWVYPTGDRISNGHFEISLNGSSVLLPLVERQILAGDFVAKGAKATDKISNLIHEATPAPVEIPSSFTLNDYYVFDPGTSYLDVIWGLIRKADWCMRITCDGTIRIEKKPTAPSFTFDRSTRKLILDGVSRQYDRSGIPNRLKVIDHFGTAYTVENRQTGSNTSYGALGRWVDSVDSSPQPKDGETIMHYAKRQLEILSTVQIQYTLPTTWLDGVLVYDLIPATLPNEGISGDLRVVRQQINCGTSLSVTMTAAQEIKEYQA